MISNYRGYEYYGKSQKDLKALYDKKGYEAERDHDYRLKHDYWQHAEGWYKRMMNID